MRTIGLIGGTTWVSTVEYYRIINEMIQRKLGKTHSAHCIIYSIDFEEIIQKHLDEWDVIADSFTNIAKKLEQAGCDFVALCANTPHKIAEDIQKNIDIPLLHIVDATANTIIHEKINCIGLLGTKYTMGEKFFRQRLKEKFEIDTIVPDTKDQSIIHEIIFRELAYEIKKETSKKKYIDIINRMVDNGAEGIILGCTEIPLLINQEDLTIPLFDTTKIHAEAIAEYALERPQK